MKNRHVGILIVAIAVLIGFLVWLFNRALTGIINNSCSHGPTCPMWGTLRLQTNIGLTLMAFIVFLGLYIIFFIKDNEHVVKEVHREVKVIKEQFKPKKFDKKNYSKLLHTLDPEEKAIITKLLDNEGSLFQSKLVSLTGQSKVKVTRILDRLEGKGLIERKRRGMTNIVFLKQ
ncbi:MAG TPA: MarR family transcriptional regulator [Alphaproteobacteria bacterium]|nr:MarR family transcriptional regulator [Alphaproteobacteria bacterium]